MNALDYAKRYQTQKNMFVCSGCGETVSERDVYEETHDIRRGGCGQFVVQLTKEEAESIERRF